MDRKRKLNWLILTDEYDEKKGGPLVTHLLAKSLHDFGDIVKTNTKSPFPEIENFELDFLNRINTDEWIVLCTEADDRLNHLPNIVRLILYYPGHFGSALQTFKGHFSYKELVFQYSNSFTKDTIYEHSKIFTPIFTDTDFWVDEKKQRSDKDLILIKKGRLKIEQTENNRILDNENYSNQSLKEAFNIHKKFITYDNNTFHSIQASLSGAISIVIPDGTKTEEEWRKTSPLRKWGIAFGDTPEQIKYAIETRNDLRKVVYEFNNNTKKQIQDFRNIVMERFTDKKNVTVIIYTKWENLYLIDQIENLKKDENINQIIIISNNSKHQPKWLNIEDLEIIESSDYKIPSIENAIQRSINEVVILMSDKVKFETNKLTNTILKNQSGLGLVSLDSQSFLTHSNLFGFVYSDKISEENNKINSSFLDKILIFNKSNFLNTPGLKEHGLEKWLTKLHKKNIFLKLGHKVFWSGEDFFENDIKKQDLDILNKIL